MTGEGMRSGGCLCGAVRFLARPARPEMDVCHCGFCRRWSGGTFMAVPCEGDFELTQSATLGIYRSSAYGERLFCKTCGSSLAWRMQDGSMHAVSFQAFDDQEGFHFAEEIFVDEKPTHYAFANDTRKLTGADVMAQFANEQGA
ncbi:GFA family protein [Aureimonas sp. AU40]|uniref:GFA family protein n=1 Tax=Aureimonas sp. AU40 TaxID=1637747 RepID=UPI0007829A13|nr:GFA family protein [Aureimonas sp. AU40]